MRAARVPLFSLENHVAAADFDVLAFNLSLARLHERGQSGGPRRAPIHAAERDERSRWWCRRHCTFNPERWPTSSTPSFSAMAKRWWGDQRRARRPPAAPHRPPSGPRGARPGPRGLRPEPVRAALRGRPARRHRAPLSRVPDVVEKRTISDLAEWPYPRRQLVPVTRSSTTGSTSRSSGCTRGCRFCQAGMITRPVASDPPPRCSTWCARVSSGAAMTR